MLQDIVDNSPPVTLLVGQDSHGHWLVQERDGEMEGSFVSRDAVLSFARWERHAYASARIELSADRLTPRLFK